MSDSLLDLCECGDRRVHHEGGGPGRCTFVSGDGVQCGCEAFKLENAPPQGVKHDAGKLRWDLLPWGAVGLVVEIVTFGAAKYGDRNWENGIQYSRVFAATQRHLTAWWQGEDLDPESGKSHIAHVACNVLFLLTFVGQNRKELDDRPGKVK
jgi:hypothetical protein